jgi:hypothetical protein
LSVFAGQRRQALHLLRVCDLDVPAFLLERVVDEPRAGHRLDHRPHRLPVDLVDAPGQSPQRIGVRRRGELVQVLAVLVEKTDVDLGSRQIQSGVQH